VGYIALTVKLDNFKLKELVCTRCGDKVVAIGIEDVRTEGVFHPATHVIYSKFINVQYHTTKS